MSNAFSLARFDNGGVDAVTTTGVAQVGAAALTGAVNLLTTAAGQTAAVLPANAAYGSPVIVRVGTATAALIFPPTGGSINGAAANASFSVAQNISPRCSSATPTGLTTRRS